jgi:hypothetical protein
MSFSTEFEASRHSLIVERPVSLRSSDRRMQRLHFLNRNDARVLVVSTTRFQISECTPAAGLFSSLLIQDSKAPTEKQYRKLSTCHQLTLW